METGKEAQQGDEGQRAGRGWEGGGGREQAQREHSSMRPETRCLGRELSVPC